MKILVADDNPVARARLHRLLHAWGYEVQLANDGDEALKALVGSDGPRVAILDWLMPKLDGVQVCQAVRERLASQLVYLILLTIKSDAVDIVEGFDGGADEYLTKPVNPPVLRARLAAIERLLDIHDHLIEQGARDDLTDVWNRRTILEILNQDIKEALRTGIPLSVAMVDVDYFKKINDTYGHLTGDEVLADVAHRLGRVLRITDSVGRYGGEEFLVVLPGQDATTAMATAERMRRTVMELCTPFERTSVRATISVGIASSNHAADARELIKAADIALYEAKRSGRNCVVSSCRQLDVGENQFGASFAGMLI